MRIEWRYQAIRDRLARDPELTGKPYRNEFSWKLLLGLFLFSTAVALPFLAVNTPPDLFIGAVSQSDLVSRVDFSWQKPDRRKIANNVLAEHYPLYEERAPGKWMDEVWAPVKALLEIAGSNNDPKTLIERAAKSGMIIDSAAAQTICKFVKNDMHRGLDADIRQALNEWVYKRGTIEPGRYAEEIKGGNHFIEIINVGEQASRGRLVEIRNDSTRQTPLRSDMAGPAIKNGIFGLPSMSNKAEMRAVLIELLSARVTACPTLVYQAALTASRLEDRMQQELRRSSHVQKNSLLIAKGQTVAPDDFTKIVAENKAWINARGFQAVFGRLSGKTLLAFFTATLFTTLLFFLVSRQRLRKLGGIAILTSVLLAAVYTCLHYGLALNLLPVGILAGMAAFGGGGAIGMLSIIFFCLLLVLLDIRQFDAIAGFLLSGCFFAWLAPLQRFRSGLIRLSLLSAAAAAIAAACWVISNGETLNWAAFTHWSVLQDVSNPATRVLWSAGSWFISLAVLLLGMRWLRPLFGVTNNIILQDWQENPLLSRMLLEAPSTYFHCSVTAALAEAAARAVGANPVLCRIASLYHDIGKLTKPEYFTENEKGISRHDALSPYMSNLIIISHVKDGAEIARQNHLPPEIIDIIEQHHGTTQVSFFLRRAKEDAAAGKTNKNVDENMFRYPGPKPQSREAGIIMLADSIEAASRSLTNASPAHIRELVNKIIAGKLHDHQLDDTELDLVTVTRAADAITLMLSSMFHSRVSYEKKK